MMASLDGVVAGLVFFFLTVGVRVSLRALRLTNKFQE
jgi:hypothetical protein